MNVLVAYATAHGSTGQVADEIGRVLSDGGVAVDVVNVKDVRDIGHYDVLVLGSAIHTGSWLPELTDFFRRFEADLTGKPVYLWVSCIRVLERYGDEHVREYYLNHEILNRLSIRNIAVFAGKLNLEGVDWNERWTLAARYDGSTWPSNFDGDYRNWDKIRDWANRIVRELSEVKVTRLSE